METTTRYIDVNIFVYWLGNHPKFGETAYRWIQEIESSAGKTFFTSSITVYETLVIMAGLAGKNLKNADFVEEITYSLTHMKGLTIEPLKPEDLTNAADLISVYKIDYEDALHLATATRIGAKEIVTNDKHFNATSIKSII
ncbi:MAG: type II toxin-antitoxin system VapC family toxin [Candidatus Bathyarchaeia archaeon]|jgi:predicted nucleic acid-binding protein